jgi:hypothetical protein
MEGLCPVYSIYDPCTYVDRFIAGEWSTCSVTCGEGVRHRKVHCKIFLEFSRTIAELLDHQCSGPKPIETERCLMEPCGLMENSLAYRIDTVGDSSYVESSLTDDFKSSSSVVSGGGSAGGYESNVKVAPGSPVKTSYSWKELGYTACSATCLGGEIIYSSKLICTAPVCQGILRLRIARHKHDYINAKVPYRFIHFIRASRRIQNLKLQCTGPVHKSM